MNTLKFAILFYLLLPLLASCGNKQQVKFVDITSNELPFSEEWEQQSDRLFNIGDRCYTVSSSKVLTSGVLVKVKTNSGMFTLSVDKSGKLVVMNGARNLMDGVRNENTSLDADTKIQLSNVDLDGDGKKELVVTIGAPHTGLGITSFVFTSELKYVGKVDGWDYMFLNKHRHVIAPHSALRWYDYYCYRNGEIKNLGEVDIDNTSQQPHVNQKEAEKMLYNELRNTK